MILSVISIFLATDMCNILQTQKRRWSACNSCGVVGQTRLDVVHVVALPVPTSGSPYSWSFTNGLLTPSLTLWSLCSSSSTLYSSLSTSTTCQSLSRKYSAGETKLVPLLEPIYVIKLLLLNISSKLS